MKNGKVSIKGLIWAFLSVVGALFVMIFIFMYSGGHLLPLSKMQVFETFCRPVPASAKIVACGYDRDVFGRDMYAVSFTMPESELKELLLKKGYKAIALDMDPLSGSVWSQRSFDEECSGFLKTNYLIRPTAELYILENSHTRRGVLYIKEYPIAVYLGMGKFQREASEMKLKGSSK